MLGKVLLLPFSGNCAALTSSVIAAGWRAAPCLEMNQLREQVAAAFPNLSNSLLKHVDEQALVALAAISEAIARSGRDATFYQDWGVICASRYLGRKRIADSCLRFRQQGAWSASPHVIPNCSLHSVSGIVSQALRLHGPNIGAGGVPGAESEAFWAALSWLHGEKLPGVWTIFTAWDRESFNYKDSFCRAVVIGLSADDTIAGLPLLSAMSIEPPPVFRFEELWDVIHEPRSVRWEISGGEFFWQPKQKHQREAA